MVIKCDKYTCKEKLSDGRHWQVSWGKNQRLDGERHVSKCQGLVVCRNDKCPMWQVHNIANEAAFAWGTLEGSYQCSKCLQYSERQWCGTLRASEWNRDTMLLTIWHQGKHICLLKKPLVEKDDAMKMVNMFKNVMQLHLHATKTQIMDLGSEYHLVHGENQLSHLFVQICMENKLIYDQALQEI